MKHPWANRSLLQGVQYTLCLTEDQFNSACKSMAVVAEFNNGDHATTYHFENGKRRACIVVVRDWQSRSKNEVLALLVHEAVHVWQETKLLIGESAPGREIEAYALQNITQELFDLFDRFSGECDGDKKH